MEYTFTLPLMYRDRNREKGEKKGKKKTELKITGKRKKIEGSGN